MKFFESELVINFLRLSTAYCIVYPPWTTEQICAKVLDLVFSESEGRQFIQYHRKRTILTAVIHSLLPVFYISQYAYLFFDPNTEVGGYINQKTTQHGMLQGITVLKLYVWLVIMFASLIIPPLVMATAVYWYWRHPLTIDLQKYARHGQNWQDVAIGINNEFRRPDKLMYRLNAFTMVIATENWVINSSAYSVRIAHLSDTALIAVKSDTHVHLISQESISESEQIVNIVVKSTRSGMSEFSISVNEAYFTELQNRINRPITVLSGVTFKPSVMVLFGEAFKEHIACNPKFRCDLELDSCLGCMEAMPNVKLQKQCSDADDNGQLLPISERCGNCYCRPLWCDDCMAKWFVSRQSQYRVDVWLQQKCKCPMCRASFCMLDVSYIER